MAINMTLVTIEGQMAIDMADQKLVEDQTTINMMEQKLITREGQMAGDMMEHCKHHG